MEDFINITGFITTVIIASLMILFGLLWVFPGVDDLYMKPTDFGTEICQSETGWFSLEEVEICTLVNNPIEIK